MEQELRHRAFQGVERWFRAAVAAADPEASVDRVLRGTGHTMLIGQDVVPVHGRVVVVAIGKAAVPMAKGAVSCLGAMVDTVFVLTKEGHAAQPPQGMIVREAGHPIPDNRGVAATSELLSLLGGLGEKDVVVALVSGGGSALLEAPVAPVMLDDMATVTDLLLRAGAPIQDLNRVRRALSRVKAGGLRRAAPRSRFVTLILSDVLGNDVQTIASGPTVEGHPDRAGALATLHHYSLDEQVPERVRQVLSGETEAEAEEPDWARDIARIIGDNDAAIEAAAEAAIRDGLTVEVLWRTTEGEAADLGRGWVEACAETMPEVAVLIGGGEATVTVRGAGQGGRNTEFALSASLALEAANLGDWVVASLATDGQDALTGAAGAIGDQATPSLARDHGVDPQAALAENDSLAVFAAAGGLVVTGPTGTNVNDLYFAVRRSALAH